MNNYIILAWIDGELVMRIARDSYLSAVGLMDCNSHKFDGIAVYLHTGEFETSVGTIGQFENGDC